MIEEGASSGPPLAFAVPPSAIDAMEASHVLIANFRSILIRLPGSADPGTAATRAPAAAIARWLREYQGAYFKANHVLNGSRAHELRGRTLSFAGDGHLSYPEDVRAMAEPALAAGMSLSFTITLDAMTSQGHELAQLREQLPSLALAIDCSALDAPRPAEVLQQARAALHDHIGRGGEVCLTGRLSTLRTAGVLAGEAGNSTYVQIQGPLRHGLRPAHRPHDFAPCHSFFALTIDEQGDVYPCSGMLGHRPARLGSVHEPFSETLQALADHGARIESLARHGPRIDAPDVAYPTDLCALHRGAVSELSQL